MSNELHEKSSALVTDIRHRRESQVARCKAQTDIACIRDLHSPTVGAATLSARPVSGVEDSSRGQDHTNAQDEGAEVNWVVVPMRSVAIDTGCNAPNLSTRLANVERGGR